ncbi:MAG TPA: PIN domain-containing protein [Gemmatimonadaceae bacterium]|nr:PIN domain-containing protein [Gemmatimonadaceae bacterium]
MTIPTEVWAPAAAPFFAGPALIDTHIWLWYLRGERAHMSAAALRLLKRMAGSDGLLVSDISVWEVANKVSKGKLTVFPSVPLVTADRVIIEYVAAEGTCSVCDARA